MAQHKGIPKFGNWETEGEILYTQYFDNARKGKSPGRAINPNDPNESLEAFSKDQPSVHTSPLGTGSDQGVPKSKDERRPTREDDLRRYEATARKPFAESPNHRYGDRANHGDAARTPGRASGGSDRNVERSPLHPHHQSRAANKGGGSSPWERRGSSEGSRGNAPSTPGRSKIRTSGHADETPDRGSALPKFGEWDEKDPSTGEGFTDIFDKVRKEKQSGSGNVPDIANNADYINRLNQECKYESSSCSCFGWCKK